MKPCDIVSVLLLVVSGVPSLFVSCYDFFDDDQLLPEMSRLSVVLAYP